MKIKVLFLLLVLGCAGLSAMDGDPELTAEGLIQLCKKARSSLGLPAESLQQRYEKAVEEGWAEESWAKVGQDLLDSARKDEESEDKKEHRFAANKAYSAACVFRRAGDEEKAQEAQAVAMRNFAQIFDDSNSNNAKLRDSDKLHQNITLTLAELSLMFLYSD